MSFKVGDRVKIPKGVEGTVRYVGKVIYASGLHLGVELDTPAGDNNGKKKGKTYFNCKRKHGIIEKTAYFTAVRSKRGSKRKSMSSKGSKKSGRASKAPRNLSAVPDEMDDEKSNNKKSNNKKSKRNNNNNNKEASPAPKIITETKSIQTDAPKEMLAYVESEYYCKIITRLYTEENEKLRKQRDNAMSQTISLQQRTDLAEAKAKQLEYEIKQQNIELDPLREQLEMREVEIEELNIKLEISNIEIEELNEKLEENLDEYVSNISSDSTEHSKIIAMNKELQQQLAILVKVGQELLDFKDKRINSLSTESDYVSSLSERLKDLLSVEQQVLGLKTEVEQLKDKNVLLEDSEGMCQQLTQYNNELEGELTDWREWVLDVEQERKLLEELHENDEKYIIELEKEKKDLNIQLFELDKENKQFKIEKQDLQKEIFQLRNKMDRQDISATNQFEKYNFIPAIHTEIETETETENKTEDDFVVVENKTENNNNNKKLEGIWNENLKLQSQMEELRNILMKCINESVEGQGHYVQYELMKQYLPKHSTEVDYRGINVLTLLNKILYKAKFSRDLLEKFYANPSSTLLQNPNLATASHTLCPIILNQENYIRGIQFGLLNINNLDNETWKQKMLRFETNKFNKILQSYDELLQCIQNAAKTNELNFDIDKLIQDENILKSYINKQFVDYSPEKPKKDDFRCNKNIVLQNISETHYRLQSLSIKLNQFNSKLFDLVHDDSLELLKIGAVEKLFRLRNDVISLIEQILKYCQPVELGYSKEKYSLNYLIDGNKTAIKWSSLKACKHISFLAVQRVTEMLNKINNNDHINILSQLPSKRIELINTIITEEEEQNEDGLIRLLEEAFNIISDVKKKIGSTPHTTIRTTDNMPNIVDEEEYASPYWEIKSSNFRILFEKQKENLDAMKEQENEIKQSKISISAIDKELKSKQQTILILTEQNIKEKNKSIKLAETEKQCNVLENKNEKFKNDILNFTSKISSQNEEIAAKSAAIEKYKKAISRIKEKESPLGPKQATTNQQSNNQQLNCSNNQTRHGILLVDNEIEYSSLLQQTIQSLRRKITELTINKKIINCNINLKPLPFTLMRDKIISNINQQINKQKEKHKKKKRIRIKNKNKNKNDDQKEEKDEKDEEEESEYEWVTDDDETNENIKNDQNIIQKKTQLIQLKKEQEIQIEMENKLNDLSKSLENIISQPKIIDLTKKRKRNNDLTQEIIGRQMKLRDVGIQCQKIKNNLVKQIEHNNNNNNNNNNKQKQQEELGQVLGTIQIPNSSLQSLGYDRTHKVLLPSQSVNRLQASFLW